SLTRSPRLQPARYDSPWSQPSRQPEAYMTMPIDSDENSKKSRKNCSHISGPSSSPNKVSMTSWPQSSLLETAPSTPKCSNDLALHVRPPLDAIMVEVQSLVVDARPALLGSVDVRRDLIPGQERFVYFDCCFCFVHLVCCRRSIE